MTFAEKLTELRKQKGWSQEELGERLGVTRQTVSKWELGMTTPEMEKLAAMSELFGISLDELVKGARTTEENMERAAFTETPKGTRFVNGEYKSSKTLLGMPVVHITRHGVAKGFVAIGLRARGVISIGLLSVGVISIGLLAFGVFVYGLLAIGGAASGMLAVGILACGGISMGIFSIGGVSFGWLSFGGVSIGKYAIGGYASGDIAVGGTANGIVALGDKTSGEVMFNAPVSAEEFKAAVMSKLPNTPNFVTNIMSWFAESITFD